MPLAEHDCTIEIGIVDLSRFQFTCPSRSTTYVGGMSARAKAVSIHVPLAEHDLLKLLMLIMLLVSIHVPLAEHDL